jgi:NAD(P)-dependent dehydrogenase (short-subunit alcohol dehydrogenase family)
MELVNKTVLVTGAGRGIGAAVAAAIARRGARVAVTARRQEDAIAVASEISTAGGQALAFPCHVANQAEVEQTVQLITDKWGRVDVLVSNAGTVQPISRIAEADPQAWLQAIEVNLVGAFFCLRAVLPQMLERRSGVVIHLSSGAAHRPLEGWSAYCASKAGLAMLTRSLHEEYAEQGICAIG